MNYDDAFVKITYVFLAGSEVAGFLYGGNGDGQHGGRGNAGNVVGAHVGVAVGLHVAGQGHGLPTEDLAATQQSTNLHVND